MSSSDDRPICPSCGRRVRGVVIADGRNAGKLMFKVHRPARGEPHCEGVGRLITAILPAGDTPKQAGDGE